MPSLRNTTTLSLQSLTQLETEQLNTRDRGESSSDEDSINAPTTHLSKDDIIALGIKRFDLLHEAAWIKLGLELARVASSTTSSTQTDDNADIPAVVENIPKIPKAYSCFPVIASLKKCVSPLGLTMLALVTSVVYFALQYELSAKANNLALRESCRSHPVRFHLSRNKLQQLTNYQNDTYLQSLAICQDASYKGDVDMSRRSLANSTVLISNLANSSLDQLLTNTSERIKQLLVLGRYHYRHVYSWMGHFSAEWHAGEFIVNFISYLLLAAVVWKFIGKIWSLIVRCLLTTLWLLLSIFFEIRVEPSPRGRHFWVNWRSPKALWRNLLQRIRNFARSPVFGSGRYHL